MSTTRTITLKLAIKAPKGMTGPAIRREVLTRINEVNAHYEASALGLPDSAENDQGYLKIKAKVDRPKPKPYVL